MKKVFTLHGCMVTFKYTIRYISEELLQVFTGLHTIQISISVKWCEEM